MECETYSDCECNQRFFLTKDEKISMLKKYKESLEFESKGVSERISMLENENSS